MVALGDSDEDAEGEAEGEELFVALIEADGETESDPDGLSEALGEGEAAAVDTINCQIAIEVVPTFI